ncbi:hypothetical protein ACFQ8O_03150 [Streptomyces coelicoflavus]|uniref:hypothetical protein n=1 Tax=Streptomyces coelicoflavus TaxID=285562 RepID=UPI0036C6FFCD
MILTNPATQPLGDSLHLNVGEFLVLLGQPAAGIHLAPHADHGSGVQLEKAVSGARYKELAPKCDVDWKTLQT